MTRVLFMISLVAAMLPSSFLRGDDLDLVKKHGPPKLIGEGKDFPFIVVSPRCPKDRRWEPFELTALLDHVIQSSRPV